MGRDQKIPLENQVGDPRAVAPDAALEAQALPQAVPSTSAAVGVGGRGKGRKRSASNTQQSDNGPNAPKSGASSFGDSIKSALKQLSALTNSRSVCLVEGSRHTCYKPGIENSYETEHGDFCPKCGTNQEMLVKTLY